MSSNYIRTSHKYYLIIKNYANELKLPKIFKKKKLVKAHFPVIKKSKTYFTRLNKKKTSILNILLMKILPNNMSKNYSNFSKILIITTNFISHFRS